MNPLTIAIRVDASTQMGTGHIVRCLTIADNLQKYSVRVIFICRILPGDWLSVLKERGFETISLSSDVNREEAWNSDRDAKLTVENLHQRQLFPNWLIIDHYQIGQDWEIYLRPNVEKIMVIDDLANRLHDCNLLLDQNIYPGWMHRHNGLLPHHCQQLLGLKYLILRDEFRQYKFDRNTDIQCGHLKILLTFGGSDPSNLTEKVLLALDKIYRSNSNGKQEIIIHVLLGKSYAVKTRLNEVIQSLPFETEVFTSVIRMIEHFEWADCAISASGLTTYELAYVGLPSLIIAAIGAQIEFAEELSRLGIHRYAGFCDNLTIEQLISQIKDFLLNLSHAERIRCSLIDGYGTDRILSHLINLSEPFNTEVIDCME